MTLGGVAAVQWYEGQVTTHQAMTVILLAIIGTLVACLLAHTAQGDP
jgi:hypothetical protein